MSLPRLVLRTALAGCIFPLGLLASIARAQFPGYEPPETILPDDVLHAILDEVSGQRAFDNEVRLAGVNEIRGPEEFERRFREAELLARILEDAGVDEVRVESSTSVFYGREDTPPRRWRATAGDLRLVRPESRRLSRLPDHPALVARGSGSGEWEGEAVFLDRRDLPRFPGKLDPQKVRGKIVVTPEAPALVRGALEAGALGIVSYHSEGKTRRDPYQVGWDSVPQFGSLDREVFVFKIWPALGEELRDLILAVPGVTLRATAQVDRPPMRRDTIVATLRGTRPEMKGLLLTAHLFELIPKRGANDNVSGCVTLAEIARTLAAGIREGKIERPERSIHFVMGDEGQGLMAFFEANRDQENRILGACNFDMVGESLGEHDAFFAMIAPLYTKMTFLETVAADLLRYLFETNVEKHSYVRESGDLWFPVPIVEKNGTRDPFRYTIEPFEGGTDHQLFVYSDTRIPAVNFAVWPDLAYHTDRDRPDRSDPTQLKRAAFLGSALALAVCSGDAGVLRRLITRSHRDRLAFVQATLRRGLEEISNLESSDGGQAHGRAVRTLHQAARLAADSLERMCELTHGREDLDALLAGLTREIEALPTAWEPLLDGHYRAIASANGFEPAIAEPTDEERRLARIVPVKKRPIGLSDEIPHAEIHACLGDHPGLGELYAELPMPFLMEFFFAVDGKRSLSDIRDLLSLEYRPIDAETVLAIAGSWRKIGLVEWKE